MEAKELAVERYRALFADKYFRNPLDGAFYPFPRLDAGAVTQVESQTGVFVVRADPPAGVSFEARVDKGGRWTELVRVAVSVE